MSNNAIDVEKDVTPFVREWLDEIAERFAGERVLRPVIFAILIREALQRLTPRERCLVLNNFTERWGRYVQ